MQKELEALASLTKAHSEKVMNLQNAVVSDDFAAAQKIAYEIGLNEENLARAGRAQVGVALLILAGLVVLAVVAGSGDGWAQPEPVGPGDGDAGTGDAGSGDASNGGTG